jgi:hypothetical protein
MRKSEKKENKESLSLSENLREREKKLKNIFT